MSALFNTIRAEAFKVVRKRRVYVLAVLYWLLFPIITLIVARLFHVNLAGSFANDGGSIDLAVQAFASPLGLATLALTGPAYLSPTFFIIAVTLITALLIGEERSQQMWKTVLVVQPSRTAVLGGKIVVAMATLGVLMLGAMVSAIFFGAIGTAFLPTDFSGDWAGLAGLYLLQWAQLLAPVLLAFLLVFVVRSAVLGIVTVLFLPSLLEGIYLVMNTIFQLQPLNRFNAFFQAIRLQRAWESLPQYFFTSNLYAPARSPLGGMAEAVVGQAAGEFELLESLVGGGITLAHAAWVMAVYALVFGALLFWSFLRRDVD